jgi:asparagine synthase (glutamine-hydrolysing)
MYEADTFPWSIDISPRKELLNSDFISILDMDSYVDEEYKAACAELSLPASKDAPLLHAKTMYLTMRYFMQTLINRTDRAAASNSLDIRVPFADFRLAEYLFQVPYEMKAKNEEVKHLLREYAKGLLPEEIRLRKKSPYPKTYDPGYELVLSTALQHVLSDSNSPLLAFVDKEKVSRFCENTKDYGKPWYGQLMAGPQLMAYYLQINYWFEKYQIKIEL